MRRSRVSEMPQRQSLRVPQRRTSSSESDGSHPTMTNRPTADRNSRLGDRCTLQNPLVEKKLRIRISGLETQLGQVQEELKRFKKQLALDDDDKKIEAQEVKETNEQIPAEDPPHIQDSQLKGGNENPYHATTPEENAISEGNLETDVFEVPLMVVPAGPKTDLTHAPSKKNSETKSMEGCSELAAGPRKLVEPLKLPEKMEVSELKVKLEEKGKEIESICAENDVLKQQVSEAEAEVSVACAKEEEISLKLSRMGEELEETKAGEAQVIEELKAALEVKIALETEMKKMRVQTEQCKKAASTAASLLAGELEMNVQKVPSRSSSLGKQVGGFDVGNNYGGFDWLEDFDEGLESGKRKGTGIRMFGDLWKKKGQK